MRVRPRPWALADLTLIDREGLRIANNLTTYYRAQRQLAPQLRGRSLEAIRSQLKRSVAAFTQC